MSLGASELSHADFTHCQANYSNLTIEYWTTGVSPVAGQSVTMSKQDPLNQYLQASSVLWLFYYMNELHSFLRLQLLACLQHRASTTTCPSEPTHGGWRPPTQVQTPQDEVHNCCT